MALHDWIHKYPQVQLLLDSNGETLLYEPDVGVLAEEVLDETTRVAIRDLFYGDGPVDASPMTEQEVRQRIQKFYRLLFFAQCEPTGVFHVWRMTSDVCACGQRNLRTLAHA